MTNVVTNAEINVLINTTAATKQLRTLQSQITSLAVSEKAAHAGVATALAGNNAVMRQNLDLSGKFRSQIIPMSHSVDQFSRSLDKSNLSLNQYVRGVASQMPLMRKTFKREFDMMSAIATDRVKKLQTQYTAMGNAKAMAFTPTTLEKGYATQTALAAQKQMLLNKMISDGSTKLVNWGKNTQWAGRQLMVGMTLPLTLFGAVASKVFMDLDRQARDFKRVYGDAFTPPAEINKNLEAIKALGLEYTKYGVKVQETLEVGATAAAAGMRNNQLLSGTEQTLRLSTIGQIDYQQALKTTISLQNAFKISNEQLAPTVDYIGAVANQTVLTVDDMTKAIPRVAPVIAGLGGGIKDLSVMLVAMREGGVSAEQGANALKSGLASLINPTKGAIEATSKLGINIKGIVNANRGDLMGTVQAFGRALQGISKFERQQVLEKVFGKYQYARLGALFDNITKKSKQTAVAMDLMGKSSGELAELSAKSLREIEESTTAKFESAVERLKVAIAPIGEAFLKAITPIANGLAKIADWFNDLPDGVKSTIALITGLVAGIGPVVLMLVGLIANGIGQLVKFFQFIRKAMARLRGDASAFQYMSNAELEAASAAQSLEGSTTRLTEKLLMQKSAVSLLASEYGRLVTAMAEATAVAGFAPIANMAGKAVAKHATGIIKVPGSGSGDIYPALLEPGESVVTKKATQKYAPVLSAMNAGTLPGFYDGIVDLSGNQVKGSLVMAHGTDSHDMSQSQQEALKQDNAARKTGGNREISDSYKIRGLSNLVFPVPEEFNRNKMSGTESSKLFDPKNKAVFEKTMYGVYNAVAQQMGTDVQSAFTNNPGLKKELDSMGANVGRALNVHGTKAVMDSDFYSAVNKGIGGKGVSPATQQLLKAVQSTTTTAHTFRRATPAELASNPQRRVIRDRIGINSGLQSQMFPGQRPASSYTSWWGKMSAGKLTGRMFPFGRELGGAIAKGTKSALSIKSPAQEGIYAVDKMVEGVKVGTTQNLPEAQRAGSMLGEAYLTGATSKISKAAGISNADQARTALSTSGSGGGLTSAIARENARLASMTERQRLAESYRYRIDSGIGRIGSAARGAVSGARTGVSATSAMASGLTAKLDMWTNDLFRAATKTKQGLTNAGQAIISGAEKLNLGLYDAATMAGKVPAAFGVGVANRSPSMALEAMGLGRKVDSASMAWNSALTKAEALGASVKSALTSAGISLKGAGLLVKDVGQALSNRDPKSAIKMIGVDASAINKVVQTRIATAGTSLADTIVLGGDRVKAALIATPEKIKAGGVFVADALKNAAANIAAAATLAPSAARRAGSGFLGGIKSKFNRTDENGYPASLGYSDQPEKSGRMAGIGRATNTATMALMGLSMAGSFAGGALGDLSQKAMMVSMGLMGLQMVGPMIMTPFGALAAGLGIVGGSIYMFKRNLDNIRESGMNLANSLITTTDKIKAVGDFYGRESIVKKSSAITAGTTVENQNRADEFFKTDAGKSLAQGFTDSLNTLGSGMAAKGFANNLATMVLEGTATSKQARDMADALERSLGIKGIAAKIKGNLTEITGPNGEDVFKDGITVALRIQANNTGAIEGLQGLTDDALKAAMSNVTTAQKDLLNLANANDEDLSLGPIPMGWTKWFAKGALDASEEFANLEKVAVATGAALGNSVKTNFDITAAAVTRLDSALKKAQDIKDPDKRKKAIADLKLQGMEVDSLLAKQAKAAQKTQKWFNTLQPTVQDSVLQGVQDSARNLFKDTEQAPFLDSLLKRTGAISDKTIKLNIELGIASGQIGPYAAEQLFSTLGDDTGTARQLNLAVKIAGADKTGDLIDSLVVLGNKKVTTNIVAELGGNLQSVTNIEDVTRALKAINELPESMRKQLEIHTMGAEDLMRLGKVVQRFDKLPDKVTKERLAEFFENNFDHVNFGIGWFQSLPDSVQKSFVASYTVNFQQNGNLTAEGWAALVNAHPGLGSNMGQIPAAAAGEWLSDDMQAAANSSVTTTNSDGKGGNDGKSGGGGGGGKKSNPIRDLANSIDEKLKLYTNIIDLMTKVKGKQKTFADIVKQLGVKGSLVSEMRKAGLNEVLIAEIIGKGYADAKKIWDKYSKDGKLTDLGKEMNKRSIFGNAGEQIEALKSKAVTDRNRVAQTRRLAGQGLTREQIADALSDDAVVNTLAGLKKGDKMWKQYINSIKQAAKAAEDARDPIEKATEIYDQAKGAIDNAFDAEELRLRNEYNATFLSQTGMTVADMERQVELNDRQIQQAQNLIDLKQETIDDLQHANELIQNGIDDLSRQTEIRERSSDALSHDLDLLSKQEEAIRKAYQDRIDALQKVQDINAEIVAQQQAQLNLSQALSQGDIYAATAAAAAQRAQAAQSASGRSLGALNEAMNNSVDGLRTQGGLTRDQAESQIANIKEQSYQSSLKIREEEDKIYANNLLVRQLTEEIYQINENTIEPLDYKNKIMNQTLELQSSELDYAIKSAIVADMTREQWDLKVQAMDLAIKASEALSPLLDNIRGKYDAIAAAAGAAASAIAAANGLTSGAAADAVFKATGIVVPRRAAGGLVPGTGGMDSTLVKATPKEFVIRKSMVDKYGIPMLNAINQGSFDMPIYATPGAPRGMSTQAVQNVATNISAPVYNQVTVIVPDSDASPDAIANKVVTRLTGLGNTSIRTLRGING